MKGSGYSFLRDLALRTVIKYPHISLLRCASSNVPVDMFLTVVISAISKQCFTVRNQGSGVTITCSRIMTIHPLDPSHNTDTYTCENPKCPLHASAQRLIRGSNAVITAIHVADPQPQPFLRLYERIMHVGCNTSEGYSRSALYLAPRDTGHNIHQIYP